MIISRGRGLLRFGCVSIDFYGVGIERVPLSSLIFMTLELQRCLQFRGLNREAPLLMTILLLPSLDNVLQVPVFWYDLPHTMTYSGDYKLDS